MRIDTFTPEEWYETANTPFGSSHYKNRPPAGWFDMPGSPMQNTAVITIDVNTENRVMIRRPLTSIE